MYAFARHATALYAFLHCTWIVFVEQKYGGGNAANGHHLKGRKEFKQNIFALGVQLKY